MTKSTAAFQLSVRELAQYRSPFEKDLFLWTFTLPTVTSSEETKMMWNHLLTLLLQHWPKLRGLRVFELHHTHGVHAHLLTHMWINVRYVRAIAEQAGWGRVHAGRIAVEAAGPYLTKTFGRRVSCMKGWRVWSGFGNWTWTKVASVVVDTPFSRIYKACKSSFGWESNYDFFERMRKVNVIFRRTIIEGWQYGFGPGGRPYSDFGLFAILGHVRGPGVFACS